MNRLPAFGIALIVAAILSVAAPASADPFLVRSAPLTQGGRTPSLTSLPGWTVEWYGRDFGEAPLTSLGNREQSFSVFRDEFPQLNRGGQVNLSKGVSFGGSSVSGFGGGVPPFRASGGHDSSHEGESHENGVSAPSVVESVPASAAGASVPSAAAPPATANPGSAFSVKGNSNSSFKSNGNSNASFAGASSVVTSEPASLLLVGSGLAFAGFLRLRKRAGRA